MKLDLSLYDAIIFDLGVVIIDLDISATEKAFKELYKENHDSIMEELSTNGTFNLYETGYISTEEFVERLASASQNTVENAAIKSAWNKMLLDIPSERYDILKKVKASHKTFCLSNTNELHINFIYNQLDQQNRTERLQPYFDKIYLSHEINLRKPNVEIFEHVIQEQQLNPSRTLFIDDTLGHTIGARKAGLNVHHLLATEKLEDLF